MGDTQEEEGICQGCDGEEKRKKREMGGWSVA